MTAQNVGLNNDDVVRTAEEADIFNQGAGWEVERETLYTRSESRAWKVAWVSWIFVALLIVALIMLLPLKSVVPYVFTVDKTTGRTEIVGAVDDRQILGFQELTDKYWANEYVIARESYNYKLLQRDYDKVLLLSTDAVAREYGALFTGDEALDSKYGNSVEVKVHILSITIEEDNVGKKSVVRFGKTTKRTDKAKADPEDTQYYVATFTFEYHPSMTGEEKDLIANPMGYKVTSYRVDAEMAPVANVRPR